MIIINFDSKKHYYNKEEKLFSVSERTVDFDTSYLLVNPETGKAVEFNFTHSTGPEFEADTKYIYKSKDGLTLEVCNDRQITSIRAEMYLAAKTR
jgi:hypothetical protein